MRSGVYCLEIRSIMAKLKGGEKPLLDLEEYSQEQLRKYIVIKFKDHELTGLKTAILRAHRYGVMEK